jgi:putative transposase
MGAVADPAVTTLAHEGQAAFRNRHELIQRHRAASPNALWQADHTMFDILWWTRTASLRVRD